ncbi:MAG: hypothetical protein RR585_01890 [Coprobacillus sp.]
MILNEKEVKTCLEYGFKPLLEKHNVYIKESHLSINEHVDLQAVIIYQDHVFDLNASFMIGYQNQMLYFYDITGKVEYLFLQLSIMNILKQIITDENVVFKDNQCGYKISLPIQELTIKNQCVYVELQ